MEVAEREKPLLKDLNEHIMCQLCRGYLIDATTLVECLHSFCRGCIVRLYSGARACPICGVKTTPPLLPDTRLQRLVYLVVPGLFRSELQRRRHFLVMNPLCPPLPSPLGAINLTLDDFVSLSLEELDETKWEVGENRVVKKRSDVLSECCPRNDNSVNDETSQSGGKTRYLKCPAAVTVRHLVRLLMLKRGWEETNSSTVNGVSRIEIMYRRLGSRRRSEEEIHLLSPFWTLLDLAYIFHWKKREPMKLIYRVLRKDEMLSISEVASNYVAEDSQPVIENIQRPPTPPPSPKPSREPEAEVVEVEVRQTLENDTNLPRNLETSVDRDKETKTKKPRCEVTPVMRTLDPLPANISTRNHHHHHHHHHSKESTRSKHMGKVEHRKRRKRRNKRVIAEITTTPREDLLKLKVRLTPRPPRITSSGGGNSSGESGCSKDRLSHLRAVRREKLKALSQQHSTAARSPRAISPPSDHSPVHSPVHSSEAGEEASAKEETIEMEETIEEIIDSIPDEVVRIAQSEESTVVERIVIKDITKDKIKPEVKETKEVKEEKEIKQTKETKEVKRTQDVKEAKEVKKVKEILEIEIVEEVKEIKEVKETRKIKEAKEVKEAKEIKETKKVKETKEPRSESVSSDRTKRVTESPKKDQEILRRLGLVAVNEAIAELRDKAKQRSQHNADKTNSLDREKLERQLRESKANRVRSLLAEKQMRDALKSIMSKTNEERSCVSSTPSSVSATVPATASVTIPTTTSTTVPVSSLAAVLSAVSTTTRSTAPTPALLAALTTPPIITPATTSATISTALPAATSTTAMGTSVNTTASVPAANPLPSLLPTTTPKKKGPPPLAPLRVAKPSGFATTSGLLMSNTPKYETPLDLSSAGTVNNKVLDLSAALTTSSSPPTSSSSSSSTPSSSTTSSSSLPTTKAYPVIISETIIRGPGPKHLDHRKETSLKEVLSEAATSILGNCSTEKDQVEPLALASMNAAAANKVALRIPQPHQRISGFRVKVIKPNLSIRQIPNPQAVVASQYRNQRPNYVNTVSQQPPNTKAALTYEPRNKINEMPSRESDF